jgi:hypothetical protein
LFSTSYVKSCQPEPATILLGRRLIVAERFLSRSTLLQSVYGSNPPAPALAEALAPAVPEPVADGDVVPDGVPDAFAPPSDEDDEDDEDGDVVSVGEPVAPGASASAVDGVEVIVSVAVGLGEDVPFSSAKAAGADSRVSGAMTAVAAMVTIVRRSFMKTSGRSGLGGGLPHGGVGVGLVAVGVTGEACEQLP